MPGLLAVLLSCYKKVRMLVFNHNNSSIYFCGFCATAHFALLLVTHLKMSFVPKFNLIAVLLGDYWSLFNSERVFSICGISYFRLLHFLHFGVCRIRISNTMLWQHVHQETWEPCLRDKMKKSTKSVHILKELIEAVNYHDHFNPIGLDVPRRATERLPTSI